jgi:hypothetical protein
MPEYIIEENSVHEKFLKSTAKIQIFGGGFGNGKTACVCVKATKLITDYPGCNGLIARATFPKLNDTIRKEFKKWCPPNLIRSFPESKNSDNTAKFTMGSQINFRYVAQQGRSQEQSTSNLLSATYDFVIVDQMEDPEITEKDFYDLLGRLRGNAVYRGLDPNMPKTGPRFMMLTVNPTGNWFFKRIIKPLKLYEETGRIVDDLLCVRDINGLPILDRDGKPDIMVELFEAPTYANKRNLGADFIATLESTYRGQMRDRFLLGQWASYEGLVYPMWASETHVVPRKDMLEYLDRLTTRYRWKGRWVEGYDFGIAQPSCYLLAFVDLVGIVHIVDGFYKPEYNIKDQAKHIKSIRAAHGVNADDPIYGDPSIFRRTSLKDGTIGPSTSSMFHDEDDDIIFQRGNNDITNGIVKVSGYLNVHPGVEHPYSGDNHSPMLFVADHLDFIDNEMTAYMWQKDSSTQKPIDKPVDRDDHACDTIKYLLSRRPDVGGIIEELNKPPAYLSWGEREDSQTFRYARYGNK